MKHSSLSYPDSRRTPTIHDVAAALGMHKSTISQGLSGKGNVSLKTRARIEAVAKEMGYQPNPLAQRLATSAVNNLVCLCVASLDIGITTEKILLIQKELAKRGFESPIYTLSTPGSGQVNEQVTQIRNLCRQQPRAIICSAQAFHPDVYAELAAYQQDGGFLVTYDLAVPLECDQVIFDREQNAYMAARHLIDAGHQHLGLAMSKMRHKDGKINVALNARLCGFNRALQEAGLKLNPDWLFEENTYEAGGAQLAHHFLALKKRPTGICIVNDYMALAFMAEMLRAGVRIPEDVSVIGHDNQQVAAYCPVPLTCADQPEEKIAEAVLNLVTARLAGSQEPPRTVFVTGEIVERESVAPRRRGKKA